MRKMEEGPSFQPVLQQLIRHHTPQQQNWYYRRLHLFNALHNWCCGLQVRKDIKQQGQEVSSNPPRQFLLLVGGPGTGKSSFMADLMKIESPSSPGSTALPATCALSKERVLLRYICSFTTEESLDPLAFVRSLDEQLRAHHLLGQIYNRECSKVCGQDLLKELRKNNSRIFDGDVGNKFFVPILRILRNIAEKILFQWV